mmetsp:Transcript_23739/g.34884  ORF Transcript_23739/g.34884 Transcript_23739/m.34884 type:complete len:243 (-) Transcript_23739:2393-3121(-)
MPLVVGIVVVSMLLLLEDDFMLERTREGDFVVPLEVGNILLADSTAVAMLLGLLIAAAPTVVVAFTPAIGARLPIPTKGGRAVAGARFNLELPFGGHDDDVNDTALPFVEVVVAVVAVVVAGCMATTGRILCDIPPERAIFGGNPVFCGIFWDIDSDAVLLVVVFGLVFPFDISIDSVFLIVALLLLMTTLLVEAVVHDALLPILRFFVALGFVVVVVVAIILSSSSPDDESVQTCFVPTIT